MAIKISRSEYYRKKYLADFVYNQNELPIESMLKSENLTCAKRWTPKSITDFKQILNISKSITKYELILHSIITNLQYLEFIQKVLDELFLRNTIKNQLNKSYILTAASIIESLIYYHLHITGNIKNMHWRKYKTSKWQNSKILYEPDGTAYKTETNQYKYAANWEKEVTFKSMIEQIKNNNSLNLTNTFIAELDTIRNLRNKIHLHIDDQSSDYLFYDDKKQNSTKKLLYTMLTNSAFYCGNVMAKEIIYDFLI